MWMFLGHFSLLDEEFISDHTAVYINVIVKKLSKKPMSWGIDASILRDHRFIYFSTKFRHFLVTSTVTLRLPIHPCSGRPQRLMPGGWLYPILAAKNVILEQQVLWEKRLSAQQKEYQNRPTAAKLKEITALCSSLHSLLTKIRRGEIIICNTKTIWTRGQARKIFSQFNKKASGLSNYWVNLRRVMDSLLRF